MHWLKTLTIGVTLGLLISLTVLFIASFFDVSVLQTGYSPGKLLFFVLWVITVLAVYFLKSADCLYFLISGCLFFTVAFLPLFHRGVIHQDIVTGVSIVFSLLGLSFIIIAYRLQASNR